MDDVLRAMIYNKAIDDAIAAYSGGVPAIMRLKRKFVIDVEHVGTQTKQDVTVIDNENA